MSFEHHHLSQALQKSGALMRAYDGMKNAAEADNPETSSSESPPPPAAAHGTTGAATMAAGEQSDEGLRFWERRVAAVLAVQLEAPASPASSGGSTAAGAVGDG